MNYQLKLRTGFFETAPYQMSIGENHIRLTPATRANGDVIDLGSDIAVSIYVKRNHPELEIQAKNRTYRATFFSDPGISNLLSEMRSKLNCRITYEGETING